MARAFTVNGSSRLATTLRRAGADIAELKDTNRDAARIAMAQAITDAPVRSGRLRDTLRVGATNRAGIIRAGNNRTSASGVRYAPVVHWGWTKRGIPENPWAATAAQKTESKWAALYEALANKVLGTVKGT